MSFSMSFQNPPCDDKGRGCGNPPPLHQTLILVEKYGLKRGLMEMLLEFSVLYDCSIRFVFFYYPKFLLRSFLLYLHYLSPFHRSVILIPQSLLSSYTSFLDTQQYNPSINHKYGNHQYQMQMRTSQYPQTHRTHRKLFKEVGGGISHQDYIGMEEGRIGERIGVGK